MKQKYISTIIFTSKLENVYRHLTKENAYIHFAGSLLNNKAWTEQLDLQSE